MENEEFTFPIISGGDNTCPSSIDSPPLWRLSPAASPVPRLREARGENKSDDDDDDDDEEEEKMDVLWEDFNEELEGYNKKSNTSARDDHHMVEELEIRFNYPIPASDDPIPTTDGGDIPYAHEEEDVRGFVKHHTCPLKEVHRRYKNACAVTIGEVVALRLQHYSGHIMILKDIITDMKKMYGIQLLYGKAHSALEHVLTLTYRHASKVELHPYGLKLFIVYVRGTYQRMSTFHQKDVDDIFDLVAPAYTILDYLPAITLAEFIRNMLQKWFYDHHRAVESMQSQLTDAV
ncbi:hypothetical protein JRO89_XS07G0253400 [Xanthoceras sorbifolium]|uniref:Uncharacterized protein n=1 Tax=Xanthoceras sorbifolium TaxID=99658 RepID=A0ABQ8HUZ2_9ROSI|nr:hypothetical protein JRO89_XS07G0253400 [Xanthoceras sorbifolium]